MFRSLRLVIDTGIHWKNWSRKKAVSYFRKNSGLTDAEIESEVDRYIADPGQALAYKTGQLAISSLRRRYLRKVKKGDAIKDFHRKVLETGPVHLDLLEEHVMS